jgi:microcystin-dependent protein
MSDPYIGEVKIIAWNYPPKGWAFCNGQLLPINQNQALFSILGTTYGGDGRTNFALPNLQGRLPIHQGNGFTEGQASGEQAHTVTLSELPAHIHFAQASSQNANASTPTGNVLGAASNVYTPAGNLTTLHPQSVSTVGGSQPHTNLMPYLTLNFVIALVGIFPSRN